MDRWQGERNAPAFTLMSGDICRDLDADGFDLAIVGAVRPEVLPAVFQTPIRPAIQCCSSASGNESAQKARRIATRISVLLQLEGWLDALVLVSAEILRHSETLARAQRAEQSVKR